MRGRLHRRLGDETGFIAGRSAVVFAPHQDDETLGCGGTILRKRQAGAAVACVFMTDGATSHQHLVGAAELTRLRRAEALDAAEVLDVTADNVHFLDHPDSRLKTRHEAALCQVAGLLAHYRPADVLVPYRHDRTPDHEATYRIVSEAIVVAGLPVRVLEYPVWAWNTWPWVSVRVEPNRDAVAVARSVVRGGLGTEILRGFRTGVFVADVLDRKRTALAQHRSQMTGLMPDRDWPTLHIVSDGDFLDCFFQPYEVFRASEYRPQ